MPHLTKDLSPAVSNPGAHTSGAVAPRQVVCIAVLPFSNFSSAQDDDYFSSGFVEDLLIDLAHFSNLQVISSYTSSKIGSGAQDPLRIAQEVGVDFLLKGSLRRLRDQIRISAQLMATHDSTILWAERYDRSIDSLFDIQDDIVSRVVGAISAHIDMALLSSARKKPITSLDAYDCWLRGMDHLRMGTPAADREARAIFQQALAIDPHYSRAFAGISLSYFNDWSCQLWDQWETTQQHAYEFAQKAVRLNDTDHMVHFILGRILLYRRQFELAEAHLDRSLALNGNDADALIQIATGKAFLGKAQQGEQLFHHAMQLNPYRNIWYHTLGALIYFVQHRYDDCIQIALKAPLTDVWVDLPGFIAAAYAYKGEIRQAKRYIDILKKAFQEKITAGRAPQPGQIVAWMIMANPFRHDRDRQHMVQGLILAGLDQPTSTRQPQPTADQVLDVPNRFQRTNQFWQIFFDGKAAQLQDIKGLHDLARLISQPGEQIHCAELMGGILQHGEEQTVIDTQAKQEYRRRVQELRDQIDLAHAMNDPLRAEQAQAEHDQLIDHLSKVLGLSGRHRKENAPVERARAAVTWRIRSAINKIEAVHPALGRHLANAIRTGTFCSYTPEKPTQWQCSA